jgi:thymidylate kinase
MKNGQLIAFEGIDGVGKTTISKEIAERLAQNGRNATWHSFPGRDKGSVGELIYRLHHDAAALKIERITASSLQALHVAAHLDAIESVIIPALRSGRTIILDRYWWSTTAYGLASGVPEHFLHALIEAERVIWEEILPSNLFYVRRKKAFDQATAGAEAHYSRIVEDERSNYPIHVIENDNDLEDAIQQVLARI